MKSVKSLKSEGSWQEKVKGFDADKFIESVRESAVPTYHTASDSVKPRKEKGGMRSHICGKDSHSGESRAHSVSDDDADKYARLNLIESEVDFVKTYVARRNYNQVSKHGKPVFIRGETPETHTGPSVHFGRPSESVRIYRQCSGRAFQKVLFNNSGIARKCPPKF